MTPSKPSLAARVANWITGKGTAAPCIPLQGSVGEANGISGSMAVSAPTPEKNGLSAASGVPNALARILRPAAGSRWLMPNLGSITPQYIEQVLRGAMAGNHVEQWDLFDLMLDTWPELAACQAELVEGVMRKKMSFQPWCEEGEAASDAAVERQALVSAALRRMRPDPAADENDLDGTLRDILSGWMVGITALEIDWHVVSAGKLGEITAPRATFWVHPQSYGWNNAGRLTLRLPEGQRELPPHKFLVGLHKAKSGPAAGNALLRPLAWWWCAANFASDWLLNLAQIFGLPFRWANYDPNAPQATVDAICNMLQNMGSAGWAAFPAGTTLELKHENISGDNSPQGELLDRADRYARLLLLGQTMSGSQDSSKGGGKAFGAVESKVKDERMEAAGKYACGVLNNQLIPSILVLNYGDADEAPCVCLADETEAGADDASRDSILAGFMPLSVSQLREKYSLRQPADEADSTKPAAAKPPEVPKGEVPSAKEGKPEGEPEMPDADEIEEIDAGELEAKSGWRTLDDGRRVLIKELRDPQPGDFDEEAKSPPAKFTVAEKKQPGAGEPGPQDEGWLRAEIREVPNGFEGKVISGKLTENFSATAAKYAKGKLALKSKGEDGMKGRGARLAEFFGGDWSNRERAYIISTGGFKRWREAAEKGYDVSFLNELYPHEKSPALSFKTRMEKEVAAKIGELAEIEDDALFAKALTELIDTLP